MRLRRPACFIRSAGVIGSIACVFALVACGLAIGPIAFGLAIGPAAVGHPFPCGERRGKHLLHLRHWRHEYSFEEVSMP